MVIKETISLRKEGNDKILKGIRKRDSKDASKIRTISKGSNKSIELIASL